MQTLRQKSINGFAWNSIGHYLTQILSLLTSAVLSRYLSPDDFGIASIAILISTFLTLFASSGITTAIIQDIHSQDDELDSYLGFAIIFGTLLSVISAILSPIISYYFNENKLNEVILVLSPAFVFTCLSQVPQGKLQREFKFKEIAKASTISSLFAAFISILLALNDFGYWSLIVQIVIKTIIYTILLFLIAKVNFKPNFKIILFRKIYKYASNLTVTQILNYLHRNMDNILIGKYYGNASLGIYSRAYILLSSFNVAIGGIVSNVLHSALARKQNDYFAMRRGYTEVVKVILWISAPFMGIAAAFSPQIIYIVWGNNWEEAQTPFFWLALAGMHQVVYLTFGSIFAATNKLRNQLLCVLFITLLFLVAIILGLSTGINGVAKYYSIMSHVIFFPYSYYIWVKILKGNYWEFLKLSIPPMLIGWIAILNRFIPTFDFSITSLNLIHDLSQQVILYAIWFVVTAKIAYTYTSTTLKSFITRD